jgi:hypothetical protein
LCLGYENNQFVGFLMPRAEGVTLEELSSTELGFYSYPRHNDKLGQEWQRFDRNSPDSLVLRLKLCSNIAKAIAQIEADEAIRAIQQRVANSFATLDDLNRSLQSDEPLPLVPEVRGNAQLMPPTQLVEEFNPVTNTSVYTPSKRD